MAEFILDAKGLSCPLPLMKARKVLRNMHPGQTLEVLSNDPASFSEFRAFCESSGHELLEATTINEGEFRFVIKNSGG